MFKGHLLEMLDHPDISIRWLYWNTVFHLFKKEMIIVDGVIDPDEIRAHKNSLSALALTLRGEYWNQTGWDLVDKYNNYFRS